MLLLKNLSKFMLRWLLAMIIVIDFNQRLYKLIVTLGTITNLTNRIQA